MLRRFVAVLLQNKSGLNFGAVVVIVVGDPVQCSNTPVGTTMSCFKNQRSPPVVKHQKYFEGNHQRMLVCGMGWARSCVPVLIVAEEADCVGRKILSLPERREVSGVS